MAELLDIIQSSGIPRISFMQNILEKVFRKHLESEQHPNEIHKRQHPPESDSQLYINKHSTFTSMAMMYPSKDNVKGKQLHKKSQSEDQRKIEYESKYHSEMMNLRHLSKKI